MKHSIYHKYEKLLRKELVRALGCTEPGAVGYAAAKAVAVLGEMPQHIDMYCSANIIKNVKSVNVPNSGGMKGIEAAAVLGLLSGVPEDALEIFKHIDEPTIEQAKKMIEEGFCKVHLQEEEDNLYIRAEVECGEDSAEVIIRGTHTNIIQIKKNGEIIAAKHERKQKDDSADFMSLAGIVEFADTADVALLEDLFSLQCKENMEIAEEGLTNDYGACIGKVLMDSFGNDIRTRAKAKAAAGSDARMGGSSMPVVINSGSGNQGITLTVPVVEYAREWNVGEEKMYRAMAVSNLISIHIKKNIGKLSAFCGAVSAACGAGAAITYMAGGTYKQICDTVASTLANVGGIICDGAKGSCAAKIASSVDAAILAHEMAIRGQAFRPGDGVVADDIEETIRNFGIVGREGMHGTDITIMKLMIGC